MNLTHEQINKSQKSTSFIEIFTLFTFEHKSAKKFKWTIQGFKK